MKKNYGSSGAANTPDKSNKILPIIRLTAALKVIKYYCLGSSRPGSLILLETVASTGRQSQAQGAVASTGSSRKHTSNAHAQAEAQARPKS